MHEHCLYLTLSPLNGATLSLVKYECVKSPALEAKVRICAATGLRHPVQYAESSADFFSPGINNPRFGSILSVPLIYAAAVPPFLSWPVYVYGETLVACTSGTGLRGSGTEHCVSIYCILVCLKQVFVPTQVH